VRLDKDFSNSSGIISITYWIEWTSIHTYFISKHSFMIHFSSCTYHSTAHRTA